MGIDLSLIWIFLGLVGAGLLFWIPSIEILFLGAGAIITGILSFIIPGLKESLLLQLFSWGLSSGTMLVLLRKRFAKVFKGKLIGKDRDENIGKTAEVIEEISPDKPGRIKYQGTSWKAVSYDEVYKKGDVVEILKEENLTFVVSRSLMDAFDELEEDDQNLLE